VNATFPNSITEAATVADLINKPVWTIEDVCAWLDISHDTLNRWRKEGRFPEPRIMPGGRLVRWNSTEVLAWFDALERSVA
jgi:excisionase family DNA binding protein